MKLFLLKVIPLQGRRKQFPDGQAQLDVRGEAVNNSRANRAAKIWTLVFLAVRRRCHCTSASNWDSKAWKFSHNERKSYAGVLYLGTYPAEFSYSNSTPHKCQMRNYVSTSAENGPAMAGPAGPVLAPMHCPCCVPYFYKRRSTELVILPYQVVLSIGYEETCRYQVSLNWSKISLNIL